MWISSSSLRQCKAARFTLCSVTLASAVAAPVPAEAGLGRLKRTISAHTGWGHVTDAEVLCATKQRVGLGLRPSRFQRAVIRRHLEQALDELAAVKQSPTSATGISGLLTRYFGVLETAGRPASATQRAELTTASQLSNLKALVAQLSEVMPEHADLSRSQTHDAVHLYVGDTLGVCKVSQAAGEVDQLVHQLGEAAGWLSPSEVRQIASLQQRLGIIRDHRRVVEAQEHAPSPQSLRERGLPRPAHDYRSTYAYLGRIFEPEVIAELTTDDQLPAVLRNYPRADWPTIATKARRNAIGRRILRRADDLEEVLRSPNPFRADEAQANMAELVEAFEWARAHQVDFSGHGERLTRIRAVRDNLDEVHSQITAMLATAKQVELQPREPAGN